MSISPAMLNRAKRIPLKPIVSHFQGKEYMTYVPSQPLLSVKKFLEAFCQDNLKGRASYNELEMAEGNEWISYDKLLTPGEENVYEINYSKLDTITFYDTREKLKAESVEAENKIVYGFFYLPQEIDNKGRAKPEKNFFSFMMDTFPYYALPDYAKENKSIKNVFNSDSAMEAAEKAKQKYTNQWLYNKHSFPKIASPFNTMAWDSVYYKNLLTQILSPIVATNKHLSIDFDTVVSAPHRKDRQIEIVIKNNKNGTAVPISMIEPIDEVIIYENMRQELYDTLMPKEYPQIFSELIHPDLLTEKTIQIADEFNLKYCKRLFYFR